MKAPRALWALTALVLVTGCSQQQPAARTAAAGAGPWSACGDLPDGGDGGRFDCAVLDVPVDYAKPGGDTLQLALVRQKATGHRLGSLVIDTGGAGVDALVLTAAAYRDLGRHYDLIGYDARGTGRSAPVSCRTDRQTDADRALDTSPDTAAEAAALIDRQRDYVHGCQAQAGAVLPYIDTAAQARDLEAIRATLGEDELSFLGASHGALVGAAYAHRFPTRVGRFVLDGPTDPRAATREVALAQATALQRTLTDYTAACRPTAGASCLPLPAVTSLLAGLDAHPLPAGNGRTLTQGLAQTGLIAALQSQANWPALTVALDHARHGDGATLLAFADDYAGRDGNGAYSNTAAAGTAVACADSTRRYTEQDVRQALPAFQSASPVFGSALAWSLIRCTGWPVHGDPAGQDISAPQAPRMLVLATTGDPAAPYAGAAAFTRELGGPGRLLTLDGDGHGAYDSGDPCVRKAVEAYLLHGDLPGPGCPNGR